MIRIERLVKCFGKFQALHEISLTIPDGKSTAILGPNASGKSTLLKCILGLVKPTSGQIWIADQPVVGGHDYRKEIGYLPQIARFPENIRVSELFELLRDLRNRPAMQDTELLEKLGLAPFWEKPLQTLSGGTRQKVNAALAFLFAPQTLLLDEPTVGMDPVAAVALKDKIQNEKLRGKTIVLTSHIMSEVEELADEIALLLEGRLHFHGPLAELRTITGEHHLERAVVKLMERK